MLKKINIVYCSISSELITKNEILLIQEAAKYGKVTVGLLTDKAIAEYKRIPFMSYNERFQIISNINLKENSRCWSNA